VNYYVKTLSGVLLKYELAVAVGEAIGESERSGADKEASAFEKGDVI
jgi:hypothetical protein